MLVSRCHGLRLLDVQAVHQVAELLPRQQLCFACIARPPEMSVFDIQSFIKEDESCRLVVESLYPVASPAAEQVEVVGIRIHVERMPHDSCQPLDLLSHVRVSADHVDVADTGKIA